MKCVGELYDGANVLLVVCGITFQAEWMAVVIVYLVLPWCLFSIVRRYLMAHWAMKMLA
jgi:hypothetical protein